MLEFVHPQRKNTNSTNVSNSIVTYTVVGVSLFLLPAPALQLVTSIIFADILFYRET